MQVHKARLHDGRQVAVKVQYLGLEAAVAADMATLSALSTVAAWLFPKSFELGWVLDDLRRNLALELDFRLEAENAAKLMHFFRGRRNITAPAVIPEVKVYYSSVLRPVYCVQLPCRQENLHLSDRWLDRFCDFKLSV
jgi:aarF domain-containing kinase